MYNEINAHISLFFKFFFSSSSSLNSWCNTWSIKLERKLRVHYKAYKPIFICFWWFNIRKPKGRNKTTTKIYTTTRAIKQIQAVKSTTKTCWTFLFFFFFSFLSNMNKRKMVASKKKQLVSGGSMCYHKKKPFQH